MSALELSLFGRFTVRCAGKTVDALDVRKAQELFCYLLLYRQRPHHRERIASLLWQEVSDSIAKRYLSKALWQLQNALDLSPLDDTPPLFCVDPEWICINQKSDIWLDVAIFEEAYHSVQNVSGRQLDSRQVEMLERAIGLYHGELLEGWYHDWCVLEREKRHHQLLQMLDKLIDYFEQAQQYENGLHYGQLVLQFDRARERTHRRLMRLHFLSGDRTGALRQYARCAEALREELNVEPSARTKELYEKVRADHLSLLDTNPRVMRADTTEPPVLKSVLLRLQQLQPVVEEIHAQLESDIQLLEMLLRQKGQA